jgi:NADPH-dependent curcumin reductase CurA
MQNTRILLNQRPVGIPTEDCWKTETVHIPEIAEGEVLVKTKYLSIDPAMRGWMNDSKSYIKPVELGETMRALAVGEIIASKNPKFTVGEFVSTATGVQEYAIIPPRQPAERFGGFAYPKKLEGRYVRYRRDRAPECA